MSRSGDDRLHDLRGVVSVSRTAVAHLHGRPATPQGLVNHACINLRRATVGGFYAWEFAKDGRDLRVRVDGQLTLNSTLPMVDAALSGYGIAYVPEDLVSAHIADGRLTLLLDEWSPRF